MEPAGHPRCHDCDGCYDDCYGDCYDDFYGACYDDCYDDRDGCVNGEESYKMVCFRLRWTSSITSSSGCRASSSSSRSE